jgi:endonuclease-3
MLEALYGAPKLELDANVLDCLILTILSQNTTDVNRDKGYEALKARFPTWEEVLEADVESIGEAIKIAGLHAQKSRTIKDFLAWLKKERRELDLQFLCEMDAPAALEFLTQHKGIGVKTASVTLAFACGRDVFPVDTHILRISKRLGFIPPNCTAEKAHGLLPKIIPEGKAYPFHVNLITFGRKICNARKPRCDQCPLTDHCLFFKGELQGA